MLSRFVAITVPDARVATVLAGLGADPARITAAGSLKRGADRLPSDPATRSALEAAMGQRPRWLAASTHPGEEEVIATPNCPVCAQRATMESVMPCPYQSGITAVASISTSQLGRASAVTTTPVETGCTPLMYSPIVR